MYVCTDLGCVIPLSASEFHKSWWQPVYLATQDNIELYRRMYVRTYIRTYIGRLVYMYCTCTYLCKYNSVNPTTGKVYSLHRYAYCSWCTCILSVKLCTYIHSYTRGILVVCTYMHTYTRGILVVCTYIHTYTCGILVVCTYIHMYVLMYSMLKATVVPFSFRRG